MSMAEKEQVGLVQLTQNDVTGYLEVYQALNEYALPKLTSTWFTYHKKKDKATGKYLDDGKCRVCDKDRQYLLVRPGIPPICEKCYQSARAYKNLLFDPLHLKSKRDLTVSDCKKIVKYMNTYSKKKLLALAAIGTYLALKK